MQYKALALVFLLCSCVNTNNDTNEPPVVDNYRYTDIDFTKELLSPPELVSPVNKEEFNIYVNVLLDYREYIDRTLLDIYERAPHSDKLESRIECMQSDLLSNMLPGKPDRLKLSAVLVRSQEELEDVLAEQIRKLHTDIDNIYELADLIKAGHITCDIKN